jgi:hypothetical protein
VSDDDDRKKRLAALIRNNVRPKSDCGPPPAISVSGNHNFIAARDVKIVVQSSPRPSADAKSKIGGKKPSWREELEGLIWQRVWDLGMTAEQFYELAEKQLSRTAMSSLAKVNECDLGVLYAMLTTMRRPALDD